MEASKDLKYLRAWYEYDYATMKISDLITTHTLINDYIFSEILHLNLLTKRKCLPNLCDISHTRIISGKLKMQELIDKIS